MNNTNHRISIPSILSVGKDNLNNIGEILVNHPYEEIKNLKNNKVNKIGFEYGKSKR